MIWKMSRSSSVSSFPSPDSQQRPRLATTPCLAKSVTDARYRALVDKGLHANWDSRQSLRVHPCFGAVAMEQQQGREDECWDQEKGHSPLHPGHHELTSYSFDFFRNPMGTRENLELQQITRF
jgi:hypothetical protein